jgi:hypothetical protein
VTPEWKCPRRVGFLFPHPCARLTPEGCPDCQNGQIADPYSQRTDRFYYTDYDSYEDIGLLFGAVADQFTEADGESLVAPDDSGVTFEDDLSAS